jgi:hypothetical protein
VDSRPFFERRAALLVWLLLAGGCATVKPHEKELLADPAMVYGSGGQANRQEEHVLDNRAGASASSTSAGGCGCN